MELVLNNKINFLDAGDLVNYNDEYCLITYDGSAQNCWILINLQGVTVDWFETIEDLTKNVEFIAKSNKIKLVVEE